MHRERAAHRMVRKRFACLISIPGAAPARGIPTPGGPIASPSGRVRD